MDNCGKPGRDFGAHWPLALRACSACAGDYEDPDRAAPPEEDEEGLGEPEEGMAPGPAEG